MDGRGLVVLIRHGRTAGNANRVVQVPETPLDDHGISQARALAERLAGEPFPIERIVASDLRRAAMTAEAVHERLGAPLEFDALLHERSFGDLRGTPYTELAERRIDPFAPGYEPPGGESWPVFRERVRDAWDAVERRSAACREGALAVVTHGLVCGELVHGQLGHPASDETGGFGNTAVTWLRRSGETARPWRVELLACTRHLE